MAIQVLKQEEINEVSGGLLVAGPGLTLDFNPITLLGFVGTLTGAVSGLFGGASGLLGGANGLLGGLLSTVRS